MPSRRGWSRVWVGPGKRSADGRLPAVPGGPPPPSAPAPAAPAAAAAAGAAPLQCRPRGFPGCPPRPIRGTVPNPTTDNSLHRTRPSKSHQSRLTTRNDLGCQPHGAATVPPPSKTPPRVIHTEANPQTCSLASHCSWSARSGLDSGGLLLAGLCVRMYVQVTDCPPDTIAPI